MSEPSLRGAADAIRPFLSTKPLFSAKPLASARQGLFVIRALDCVKDGLRRPPPRNDSPLHSFTASPLPPQDFAEHEGGADVGGVFQHVVDGAAGLLGGAPVWLAPVVLLPCWVLVRGMEAARRGGPLGRFERAGFGSRQLQGMNFDLRFFLAAGEAARGLG